MAASPPRLQSGGILLRGWGGKAAWRDHVITVGPVRPVVSWSWETFRAMSTRGASITCTRHTNINKVTLPVSWRQSTEAEHSQLNAVGRPVDVQTSNLCV